MALGRSETLRYAAEVSPDGDRAMAQMARSWIDPFRPAPSIVDAAGGIRTPRAGRDGRFARRKE